MGASGKSRQWPEETGRLQAPLDTRLERRKVWGLRTVTVSAGRSLNPDSTQCTTHEE